MLVLLFSVMSPCLTEPPAVSLLLSPGSAASPPLHRQRQTDQIVFTLPGRCTYFVQYIFYFTSVCVHKLIFLVLYFLKINLKMREMTVAASASLLFADSAKFTCGSSVFALFGFSPLLSQKKTSYSAAPPLLIQSPLH